MSSLLRRGSRGIDVAVLQTRLNTQAGPGPRLKVDGDFGMKTHTAVQTFQRKSGLKDDGIVGPKTGGVLARGPAVTSAQHRIRHIPQPTKTTCWAASTAMMTNSTVAAVQAKTPTDMVSANGGLLNSSGTDQAIVTGSRYGRVHGLSCHAPMSWSVGAFVALIQRSPVMLDMLWRSNEYAQGSGSPGHMVVVSAVVSDGDPSGRGTHLLVLDPWPPNRGDMSWVEHQSWMREVPTRTYRVFQK